MMSELHLGYADIMAMPVVTMFELLGGHNRARGD